MARQREERKVVDRRGRRGHETVDPPHLVHDVAAVREPGGLVEPRGEEHVGHTHDAPERVGDPGAVKRIDEAGRRGQERPARTRRPLPETRQPGDRREATQRPRSGEEAHERGVGGQPALPGTIRVGDIRGADVGRDDPDAAPITGKAQHPHPAAAQHVMLRRVIRAEGRRGRRVARLLTLRVPTRHSREMREDRPGAIREHVIESPEPERTAEQAACAGCVDDEGARRQLGRAAFVRPCHPPTGGLPLHGRDRAPLAADRPAAERLAEEQGVDIGAEPVRVGVGVGRARGHEERGRVVGRVGKRLARHVPKV